MSKPDFSRPWTTVYLLAMLAMVNYADRTAIASVFPLLRKEFGASDVVLAAVGSFFLWAYAIGSPFAGFVADRLSRSRVVVFSLTAWSVVTLWTGFAHSTQELLATRLLLGVAECAYLPAAMALIAGHHPPATRGTALGLHSLGLNFGVMVGGATAGWLGEHFGWRVAFYALGALGLALALFASRVLRDAPDAAPAAPASSTFDGLKQSAAALGRVRSYWILLSAVMLVSIGVWIFYNWLPLYLTENFGFTLAQAGFAGPFVLQASAMLGVTAGGYLSDRAGRRALRYRVILQCVAYSCAAPFLLVFLGRPSFTLVAGCIFGFSLFHAIGSVSLNAVVCDLLGSRLRSTGIGLINTANTAAGGIGVFLTGFFKGRIGLGGSFAAISVTYLVAGVIIIAGYRFSLARDLDRAAEAEGTKAEEARG